MLQWYFNIIIATHYKTKQTEETTQQQKALWLESETTWKNKHLKITARTNRHVNFKSAAKSNTTFQRFEQVVRPISKKGDSCDTRKHWHFKFISFEKYVQRARQSLLVFVVSAIWLPRKCAVFVLIVVVAGFVFGNFKTNGIFAFIRDFLNDFDGSMYVDEESLLFVVLNVVKLCGNSS